MTAIVAEAPPNRPVLADWRPELGSETALLAVALFFSAAGNGALWHQLFGGRSLLDPAGIALAAGLFIAVTAVQFAGLALLLVRPLLKPALLLLLPLTAAAGHFMEHYAVFLDTDMLRNVMATDVAEAGELMTFGLAWRVAVLGILPALLVSRLRIRRRPALRALALRLGSVALALLVAVAVLLPQSQAVASLVRNHRAARHLVTPMNYLVSGWRLARGNWRAPDGPLRPVGLDAHRVVAAGAAARPRLLVLVIGETARSANFGLSGYARQTTPELARQDLVVFPRVESCGTSTEVSVPCMFSAVGRRDYDRDRIAGEESLLHVLRRAGVGVRWIDNQSGCKGVCDGLPTERIAGNADPEYCDGERCLDGILLGRLRAASASATGDQVIVLHMLGNHGPAYSHRYPADFRRFTPTCEQADLGECTHEEIVNAYDDALLYTDHVLAEVIAYLRTIGDRDTGLVYVSDHGESLGENGLYLHGMPHAIAPREQREVPMLMWFSPAWVADGRLDLACLRARAASPASHDHLFHSVLDLLDVETTAREPGLDLLAGCREERMLT